MTMIEEVLIIILFPISPIDTGIYLKALLKALLLFYIKYT